MNPRDRVRRRVDGRAGTVRAVVLGRVEIHFDDDPISLESP